MKMGINPKKLRALENSKYSAWEADVLPLNYARLPFLIGLRSTPFKKPSTGEAPA
jgi:hypothetical protein